MDGRYFPPPTPDFVQLTGKFLQDVVHIDNQSRRPVVNDVDFVSSFSEFHLLFCYTIDRSGPPISILPRPHEISIVMNPREQAQRRGEAFDVYTRSVCSYLPFRN